MLFNRCASSCTPRASLTVRSSSASYASSRGLSSGVHIGTRSVDKLTAYSNTDWAGCPDSRRSTSSFCVYLGDTLVSWSCSNAEAEYQAMAHIVVECCWLRQLLQELHI